MSYSVATVADGARGRAGERPAAGRRPHRRRAEWPRVSRV